MTVIVFVPEIPDFVPLIEAVKGNAAIEVVPPQAGYWQLRAEDRLEFSRKGLGLRVALWYSMLTGGYRGRISEYSRDALIIESEG